VDPAWIGVIGALGGVLVTGLIGLVTAVLNHRWQRDARGEERTDHVSETRAGLRRDAYTRFLVSTDALTDFLITQPIREDDGADFAERLRTLRQSSKQEFDEFDGSYVQVKLLCGPEVEAALTTFHNWYIQQCATAIRESDAMNSDALNGMERKREPLIEAMKAEQEADLGG
jgi:hypothetical protein